MADGRARMRLVPGERFRVVAALAAFAVVATCTGRARAAPPAFVVSLEYHAPESGECPEVEEFRASVARQLGYDAFRPTADRRVAVQISRKDGGFDSWVKWSDADGRWVGDRRLSSRSAECGEIAASTAFAVAVQIQLLATLAPSNPDGSAPSASPGTSASSGVTSNGGATSNANTTNTTGTSPARKSSPAPTPKPPATEVGAESPGSRPSTLSPSTSRARFGLSAGLGPSLALGVGPHPTGIGRIFVSGRRDWFSLELAFDAALPTKRTEPDGSGFTLNRFAAALAACGHVDPFAACLSATVGRLGAHGFGVDVPASPGGWFTQLGVRIAARHDFGERFFVGVRADGLVMLSTWSVTLDENAVWTTPRVGGLIGADLGVNFF